MKAPAIGAVLDGPFGRRGLALLERSHRWPADQLAVLTYHRIGDDTDDRGRYPGLRSATPAAFAAHVEVLSSRFDVVSIDEVLAALAGDHRLPRRAVLLTFDDAVEDFGRLALPVLAGAGLPAVVFVPTAYVGRTDATFWWDVLHTALTTTTRREPLETEAGTIRLDTAEARQDAYRRLRSHCLGLPADQPDAFATSIADALGVSPPAASVMDWDQLRQLERAGIRCCPHTRRHRHLEGMSADDVREEVEGSLDDMRRELGDVAPAFAYPAGVVTPEVRAIVASSGIAAAFTTRRGTNMVDTCDAFMLRRINVSRRTGLGAARLQMLPAVGRVTTR